MLSFLLAAALTAQAAAPPAAFDASRAWEHLRQMVAIGPRPAGSPAIEQTRTYIRQQLKAAGLEAVDQSWTDQTPNGPVKMTNLIVTVPGASRDRIIIGGHYDTKLFRPFRFVGASDGGSSAAFLIEIARVLKARRNAYTYEILFLDGEEAVIDWTGNDHTYGSRHYVDVAKKTGSLDALRAMILVDMIGDRRLDISRDDNSTKWLTDIIWDTAKKLQLDSVFVPTATRIEDDHEPFLAAGVPAVDIIDLDYPQWHTAQDTLENVSARSLQSVGDVLLAALPAIEARIGRLAR